MFILHPLKHAFLSNASLTFKSYELYNHYFFPELRWQVLEWFQAILYLNSGLKMVLDYVTAFPPLGASCAAASISISKNPAQYVNKIYRCSILSIIQG